jgi:putative tryptophan/tyrosine transport system permease protein
MISLLLATLTQSLTLIPLALGIHLSYTLLRATDMTIDGSFVLGAGVFAQLVTMGVSPYLAFLAALLCGAIAGAFTAFLQNGGRVDSLLAGILTSFILYSVNMVVMGRPNINLLTAHTLFSSAFAHSMILGWATVASLIGLLVVAFYSLLQSRLGLRLRAFGDNAMLLSRQGYNVTALRFSGFALNNLLAAASGAITAQIIGYADIGMGVGMTLIGIGAIVLGQHLILPFIKKHYLRAGSELLAAFIGITLYFFILNGLLRFNINPIYLKLLLGFLLALFLRTATQKASLT